VECYYTRWRNHKVIIRKLNEQGLSDFERFIENLRNGEKLNTPSYLLEDPSTSQKIAGDIELDPINFENRYELGVYLADKFKDIHLQEYMGDIGFWSGLALLWFDQLCPEKANRSRKPSMVYNYILSENFNHRPRHAIFTTWQLVNRYKEDARFLLCKELPVRGELIEQMMARQYFMGCEGVMRAASKLYYDDENLAFKKGAAARKSAGCVYRFVTWLQQLELTYDLFSVERDDLINLMPTEFDRFI
jgi:hypothetical protein